VEWREIGVLIVLVATFALLVWQRIPIVVVGCLTLASLICFNLVPVTTALTGFSSPTTLTIAALYVLCEGLIRTGVLDQLGNAFNRFEKLPLSRIYLMIGLPIALFSAFLNNTPVVMLMIPALLRFSRQASLPPSKLLMPVSFFAIFGGTSTLVGTSTNLLVYDIVSKSDLLDLHFFSFLPLGLIATASGLIYFFFWGAKRLPERETFSSLLDYSKRSRFVTEFIVTPQSNLQGVTIDALILSGKLEPSLLKVVELIRGEMVYLGNKGYHLPLQAEDALLIEGSVNDLKRFQWRTKTDLGTTIEDQERVPIRSLELRLVELVISPDSIYIGRTVQSLLLNKKYGVKILAVLRRGTQHSFALRTMRLKAGDVLLAQGTDHSLNILQDAGNVFLIRDQGDGFRRHEKSKWALTLFVAVLIATLFLNVPLVGAAFLGASLMILTRCLSVEEALGAVDFNVLFLLIGTIPLGYALQSFGLFEQLAHSASLWIPWRNPVLWIGLVFFVANLLTNFISNNAVAILLTPLALQLSQALSLSPAALVMAVALGASVCLITPIGYQTNLLVMGPGGYRFSDFWKVGWPLTLMILVVTLLLFPVIWPS
jgi:di/tricarboxylate transporter